MYSTPYGFNNIYKNVNNSVLLERVERILRKGTTTVGLRTKTHVVLAADRRATAGHYVAHKRTKKIIKITDYIS